MGLPPENELDNEDRLSMTSASPTPSERRLEELHGYEDVPDSFIPPPKYSDLYPSSSSPSPSNYKSLFIRQKGNTYNTWSEDLCNNPLITPIYDSTVTNVLYTSTRFKKSSGTCVLHSPAEPLLEVHTTYRFGPGRNPVIAFKVPGDVGGNAVEIEVKRKGQLTRARAFNVPEFSVCGVHVTPGKGEWSYASTSGRDKPKKAGNDHGEISTETEWHVEKKVLGKEVEEKERETEKGKEKRKGKDEAASSHSFFHSAASRMVLNYYPVDNSFTSSASPQATQAITLAEFVRTNDDGQEITSGLIGPAGQGGWLKIYQTEQQGFMLPEWLIIVTCLLMLKRERDRRTTTITVISSSSG